MPRARHIPQTDAEMRAWWWGVTIARNDHEVISSLGTSHLDPGGYLDENERAAWERLGAERFWRWAHAGARAEVEDADGIK